MNAVRLESCRIFFVDDFSLVHDDYAVRVVCIKRLGKRHFLVGIPRRKGD